MIVRKIKFKEVFLMSAIINKMGLSADVNSITKTIQTSKLENKDDATKLSKEVVVGLGIDILNKIISNLFKAEEEVYQLISNLTGKNKNEVSEMDFLEIKEFFVELFKIEGIGDFLTQAGE